VIRELCEINGTLLKELEQALKFSKDNQKLLLGQPFLSAMKKFKLYSAYVNNYDTSVETLDKVESNPQWKAFKYKAMSEGAQDLESLLIMPIQRIPRYLLLLQELFKNTPTSHPDYPLLQLGIPEMAELTKWIDTEKDKLETLNTMSKLAKQIQGYPKAFMEPWRRPVKEGLVIEYVASTKRSRYRYLFVFTDVALLTEQKKARRSERAYKFVQEISLARVQVEAMPNTLSLKNALQISSNDQKWTFFFGSKYDVDTWLSFLKKAISAANQESNKQMKSSPTLVMTIGSFSSSAIPVKNRSDSGKSPMGESQPILPSAHQGQSLGIVELRSPSAEWVATRSLVLPQTPQEIMHYKQLMIARYEAERKQNSSLLERRRSMIGISPKARKKLQKDIKKEEKQQKKEEKKKRRACTATGTGGRPSQPQEP